MKQLQSFFPYELPSNIANILINNICDDSRKIEDGNLFVAIPGNNVDGSKYIEDAIKGGALAIVHSSEHCSITSTNNVAFIGVPDIRYTLAYICANFYQSEFNKMVAVTGTNGKTSTVNMVYQIWNKVGIPSACIGTLGIIGTGVNCKLPQHLTSPGALLLHRSLSDLYQKGIQNVVMEASSHGLDQQRLQCIDFNVCAFTNFSQDHLDYHKTLDSYWACKAKLFKEYASKSSIFVVNADDPKYNAILEMGDNREIVDYGRNAQHIRLCHTEYTETGQKITIEWNGKSYEFLLPLMGDFQVYNCLCAMGICSLCGISRDTLVDIVPTINQISGRLEKVSEYNGGSIYIDYAHTPDALQKAILSLKKISKGRVIVIFGCGGNRDQQKRAIMGKTATQSADVVIITDDNPRTENPANIRKMILEGAPNAIEIADRSQAIHDGIALLQPGDILLVAGKGHEDYYEIGNRVIHYSDREIILGVTNAFYSK